MAYGARLESVLGASPQEFESLILRQLGSRWPAISSSPARGEPAAASWSSSGERQPLRRSIAYRFVTFLLVSRFCEGNDRRRDAIIALGPPVGVRLRREGPDARRHPEPTRPKCLAS